LLALAKNQRSIRRKKMAYTKPQVVAQNSVSGSYAAGCPADHSTIANRSLCKKCEMTN